MLSETRRKQRRSRICALSLFLSVISLLTFSGCAREESFRYVPTTDPFEGVTYTTSACEYGDVVKTINVPLSYIPARTENLSFSESGVHYNKTYVSTGDHVKEGDLLAELDIGDLEDTRSYLLLKTSDLALQLEQCEQSREMALEQTGFDYRYKPAEDRETALVDVNVKYDLMKQELEDSLHIAELRLQECDDKISGRRIFAPFDGVITRALSFSVSDLSSKDKTIITIADSSKTLFRGNTVYWDYFTKGMKLDVIINDTDSYSATVRSEADLMIAETGHSPGRTGYIYLALNDAMLTEESNAKLDFVSDSKENVLCVSINALSYINGVPVVYIPGENGIRSYKEVEIGLIGDSMVEIVSGLNEGELVVVG